MSAEGVWTVEMKTPLGRQAAVLRFSVSGGALTGSIESAIGSGAISDGVIEGDTLSWSAPVKLPLPVTGQFKAKIDGDSIAGAVTLGRIGDAPFKGARNA